MKAEQTCRRRVVITNERGLHARASARFVKCAERFDARITVMRKGYAAGGTSIIGLLALGAACGTELEIVAEGRQAQSALDALAALVEGGFGEGCLEGRDATHGN